VNILTFDFTSITWDNTTLTWDSNLFTAYGWTFDRTDVTFDAEVPTWDAGLFYGVAQLEAPNGSKIVLKLANVRTETFTYDKNMFRSPYGTVWHIEGDERRLVERITVQAHVIDDPSGISDAAITANVVASALPSVVVVESPFGTFNIAALESFVRVPVESGYRLDVTFVTFSGIQ
jgi:hypothetical protein